MYIYKNAQAWPALEVKMGRYSLFSGFTLNVRKVHKASMNKYKGKVTHNIK